jgi:hypothetical protein
MHSIINRVDRLDWQNILLGQMGRSVRCAAEAAEASYVGLDIMDAVEESVRG